MVMGTSKLLQVLVACMFLVGAAADGRSLAIVFDTTGSMSYELTQVIAGAQSLLQAALDSTRDWRDFFFVPFNDPTVGPVNVTSDPDEFDRILADIQASGGGDCPEMSIGGIQEAVKVVRSHSSLYVFTDATAKDYNLADQIIQMIQEKECKVVIVMTGDCGDDRSSERFQVYETITQISSGQVFEVEKGDIAAVLEAERIITIEDFGGDAEATEINLLSQDSPTPTRSGGEDAVIAVDSGSSDFTVSLSGDDPDVTVFDPTGLQLTEPKVQIVLKLPKLELVKVVEPDPGNYTVNYVSTSSHSIRIKGLSRIGFDQRFTTSSITVAFDSAAARPYQGIPVHTMIRGIGLQEGDVLSKLQFTELNGTVLQTLPLYITMDNPGIHFTDATVVPDGVFYVQVFGVDSSGYPFNRISQSTISAISAPPGIDECSLGDFSCDPNANCTDTVDSYVCTCNPGYEGDGENCANINECLMDTHNCGSNASCMDTVGGYECPCLSGYIGYNLNCTDVDECGLGIYSCDPNANCTNTVGSYECTCNPGYEGDGKTCTNVDECGLGTYSCDSNANCTDTVGSYECTCNTGYEGDGRNCTNINECLMDTHNCGSNASCMDTVGGYQCPCLSGYIGYYQNCTDVDECGLGIYSCDSNANCTNTVGSYVCTCNLGYEGDGKTCTNVDECSLGTYSCDSNANCADTVGSYECSCNTGYKGDGKRCTNVDECSLGTYSCDINAKCTDTVGSYECTCNPGYEGDGRSCDNDRGQVTDDSSSCRMNVLVVLASLAVTFIVPN